MIRLLTILLLCGNVFAAVDVEYVWSGGSGGDGETWTAAHTTLAAAESAITRGGGDGGLIYVADDSGGGSVVFNVLTSGTAVIEIRKATIADHGTSTGWVDTMGDGQAGFGNFIFVTDYWIADGKVRNEADWLDGNAYGIRITQAFARNLDSEFGGDHIILRNLDIGSRPYSQTFQSGDGEAAVYLGGFTTRLFDWTISKCFMHNGGFIQMAGVDGIVIEESALAAGYAKEAIRGQVVAKNGVIRYSLFYNASQTNPDDDPPQGSTADIAIWDDGSTGQTSFDNWDIHHLVIWNDKSIAHSGGVIFVGGQNATTGVSWVGSSASNVKIYNITVAGIQGAFTPAHIRINGGSALGTGNEVRNVLWYDCFGTPTAVPNSSSNGEVGSDPFVNYAGFDWHLSSEISGTALSSPYNVDFDGVIGSSRGAYNFESGTPPVGAGTVRTSVLRVGTIRVAP